MATATATATATAVAESDLERDLLVVGDKLSSPPSNTEEFISHLNITLVQEGGCHVQGPVDVPDDQLSETNPEPEHKLLGTNTAYDDQLSEGTFFLEPPQESGRLEQVVDCSNNSEAETTRRSLRKIVKRKFFEEESSRTKKQKKNTNKTDLAAKKKCGETSKSVTKLTKMEASVLQKSIIEKLTGELIIIDDLTGEQSPKGFEAENHGKELEGVLVGKKIKLWCLIDEEFYEGVIDSFDPVSKKHKVVYADGDKEELLLKDEYWIDLEDTKIRDSVCRQENELRRLGASPEIGPRAMG